MSLSPDHKPFLSAILENPRDDTPLLVYADWLEERGDPRSAYLRNQSAFRKSRTEELRRRLIQLYPHEHLAWAATLEQAGAVEANLTNFEFAWWGVDRDEIWFATVWTDSQRPLTPMEQAYIDHLNRRYSDRL